MWASIAIDDVILKGHKLGGIIGLVHHNSTAILANCIGNVILPTSGLFIGIIAGEVFSGTVNGLTTKPLNELEGSPVNKCD